MHPECTAMTASPRNHFNQKLFIMIARPSRPPAETSGTQRHQLTAKNPEHKERVSRSLRFALLRRMLARGEHLPRQQFSRKKAQKRKKTKPSFFALLCLFAAIASVVWI
jgi:hypothetical protein